MKRNSRHALIGFLVAFAVSGGSAKAHPQATPVTFDELVGAGKQAFDQKDFKLAEQYFSKAIAIKPDGPDAVGLYLFRAEAYAALGKSGSAIKDYTLVIKLNPNLPLVYYNRGTLYFLKEKDYKKAVKDFDASLLLQPAYKDAYINRGLAQTMMKNYDAAQKDLEAAQRLAPRDPGVYRAFAALALVQGKNEVAQAYELKAATLERQQ